MLETDSPQYTLASPVYCGLCGLEADQLVLPSGAELADCSRCHVSWLLPLVHDLGLDDLAAQIRSIADSPARLSERVKHQLLAHSWGL